MWGRLKQFLGVIPDFTDSEEVISFFTYSLLCLNV